MPRPALWTRRDLIRAGVAAALTAGPARCASAQAPKRIALGLTLTETAGLRRFSYPVHTVFPGTAPGASYRLLRDGRPVPAQFRADQDDGARPAVALDFTSSIGPLESERYVVEAGEGLDPGPEPRSGMKVDRASAGYVVTHGAALNYTIADGLGGFLERAGNLGRDFLQPRSGGLYLRPARATGDRLWKLGEPAPLSGEVTRQGPIAVALRYRGTAVGPDGAGVKTSVDLTFPGSKSWVETTWRVEDPDGTIAALSAELPLELDGDATLVDLGTAATIYGVLRGRERMTLTAGSAPGLPPLDSPWVVHKGPADKMTKFAAAPRRDSPPAEGWAHVMDASRCTALAVAGFGGSTRDRIEIETSGRVLISRVYAGTGMSPAPGPKQLSFWYHFVPMPVQIGAATSPQAMLAPLAIAWEGSGPDRFGELSP